MSIANDGTASELTIRPMSSALGAEVRGLDLASPLAEDTFQALHRAWMEHLVLVFPNQPISDRQQITFARAFGELRYTTRRSSNPRARGRFSGSRMLMMTAT